MPTYKKEDFSVVEENKEDALQTVVKRENISNEFKVGDILSERKSLEKAKLEIGGTVRLAKATIQNIERNHKFITELSEEERHHVWMHQENADIVKQGDPKLEQIEDQLKQYDEIEAIVFPLAGYVPTEVTATDDGGEDG